MSLSNGFMMYSLAPACSARAMCATSFSVVQDTTFGTSPPGMRRRLPRNSYPSITGMFQSSSTASGIARLQTSSAFSPSSASTIWKSRPSRIRRATLRMTLESSTTRHVLIVGLLLPDPQQGTFPIFNQSARPPSRGLCIRRQFEHAIDVEDDHQLAVEAVDAARELGHARIEIDGVFLAAVLGQAQHLADLVDQKAIGFPAQIDADRHRRRSVISLGQAEAGAHVDHGDDAPAQVQHAGDLA